MSDYPSKENAYARLMDFENAMCRRRGRSRMERYRFALAYFDGENLPPDNVEQPLGINYCRMINEKHTHFLFGQWKDDILGWRVTPKSDADPDKAEAKKVQDWIVGLCKQNEANEKFWEAGLNASIFGDAVFRVTWDVLYNRVRWESILPEYCHFRWRINNLAEVMELVVAYPMPRSEALAEFGTLGNVPRYADPNDPLHGQAMHWEYWTPYLWQAWVDDVNLYNRPNPYVLRDAADPSNKVLIPGIIPFVHIPNIRAGGDFYGYNDTDGIMSLQDELNRKMADEGDVINNFAHPITIVTDYFGKNEELPVGPDQVWNLGREGKAEYLNWEGTPPAVHEFVERVREMLMDTSSMSDVAFGRHKGTQQSAVAMAIEMLPVTDRARWKRMHWVAALRRLVLMSAFVTDRAGGELPIPYERLVTYDVDVVWAPILPRDRLAQVNENVTLFVNHLRSMYKALQDLGDDEVDEETKRIMDDLDTFVKLGLKIQAFAGGQGSSSLPEGGSNSVNAGEPKAA